MAVGVVALTGARGHGGGVRCERRLLLAEGGFSSVEMRHLARRMAEGRSRAYEEGAYLGGGVPLGYRRANGKIHLVPAQAAKVRRALETLVTCPSLRQAAQRSGIPYPRLRGWVEEGCLQWWTARRPSRTQPGEHIACQWEPAIPTALADQVRAWRERVLRPRGAPIRSTPYLLTGTGLLRCGYCGRHMKTFRSGFGGRRRYYSCYVPDTVRWGCCAQTRCIPMPELDARVTAHLLGTLERIADLRAYHQAQKGPTANPEDLRRQENDLIAQRTRLVRAVGEGAVPLDLARVRLQEIAAELARLDTQRAELEAADTDAPDWEALADLPGTWDTLPLEAQKAALAALLTRIRVYATYALLDYSLPLTADGRAEARVNLDSTSTTRKNKRSCTPECPDSPRQT